MVVSIARHFCCGWPVLVDGRCTYEKKRVLVIIQFGAINLEKKKKSETNNILQHTDTVIVQQNTNKKTKTLKHKKSPFCPLVGVPAAPPLPCIILLVLMLFVLALLNLLLRGRLLLNPLNAGAFAPAEREAKKIVKMWKNRKRVENNA